MNRRNLLKRGLVGAAAMATPVRAFAQVAPDLRTRRLLDIARTEVQRAGAVLWKRDLVGIADFGLHSSIPRFHFVNLEAGSVSSILVSHGSGSDPEHDGWLNGFSNLHDSWATSRGAYITWEWYEGRFGTSVRLNGLDESNDQAFPRAIVMHAASYSSPEHVDRWGRLGRSNGCFAFGPESFPQALSRLRGGRLLFAGNFGIGEDGQTISAPPQASVDFQAIATRNRAPVRADESEMAQIYREANPGLAGD